jgi:hypothetical protein
VPRFANLNSLLPPINVKDRFPLAKGWGIRKAGPARKADNQKLMPSYVSSSLMKEDNLRLMQSALGPRVQIRKTLPHSAKLIDQKTIRY